MDNAQRSTPDSQYGITTKGTKRSKGTKDSLLKRSVTLFVALSAITPFVSFVVSVTAQQVLDRVVARVGPSAITETDVDAALAFGLIDRQAGEPVKQMIDRRLILAEVSRFPPPEPNDAAVGELVAKMKTSAGATLTSVMKRTGVDEKRLAELARETLRIQSYLQQRFGNSDRAEQQRTRWLNDLRARGNVTEVSRRP